MLRGEVDLLVGVLRDSPPSRGEELSASLGLKVLQVCTSTRKQTPVSTRHQKNQPKNLLTLGIPSLSELVLLSITSSENPVSQELYGQNSSSSIQSQIVGIEREISCRVAVREGNPCQISNRQHESESVCRNIHRTENGSLRKIAH